MFPPHKLPPAPKPVLDYRDSKYTKHVKLPAGQRLIVLGFGAIGQGVLPLLFRHVDMKPEQVLVAAVDFSAEAEQHARDYGVKTVRVRLTKDDHGSWLQQHVRKGDFLLNVTVDVSSVALIQHCQVSISTARHCHSLHLACTAANTPVHESPRRVWHRNHQQPEQT